MKASHVFNVGSKLPELLAPLNEIVGNLRWSWHVPSAELFRWIDPELWESTKRNPAALMDRVPMARIAELASDPRFVEQLNKVAADLGRHRSSSGYFQIKYPHENLQVAYFSPEFGITEALPQYSGGLGVLAGDHLKSASSLGIPIVGVGLYYRDGYFSQSLRSDGWQHETYAHDPDTDRLVSSDPSHRFELPIGNDSLTVAIRIATVGRITLLLLDTDLEINEVPLRNVSDRLYGGDRTHRLLQEILLGIGGVRALDVLGVRADVFHMNEGHAGFLTLERIRKFRASGLNIQEAIEATRATTMFTTHTPVPAGIDRFDRGLIETYLGPYLKSMDLDLDEFLALGSAGRDFGSDEFNMAHMGLRLSGRANGVSRDHGFVSRELFSDLWPQLDVSQIPIEHVTNGVHARSWTLAKIDELLSKTLLDSWPEADAKEYDRFLEVNPLEIASAKRSAKMVLVDAIERRLKKSDYKVAREGQSTHSVSITPDTLVIGFARRFAPYKRATLLLRDKDRLLAMLRNSERPVAFVFAGKAHPADDPGKEMIANILSFARDNGVSDRFIFVPDYDISIARSLYQGVDVWLNTPRRPLEASGTSGMKAAMNGTLNCSILDGWWSECYDGKNGFAPTSAPDGLDYDEIDAYETASIFETLEEEVIPLYFNKNANGERLAWYEMVRYSMASLVPYISGARMVKDYTDDFYVPLARRSERLFEDDFAGIKELTQWKAKIRAAFENVRIYSFDVVPGSPAEESNDDDGGSSDLRELHIEVSAEGLAAQDLRVEVLYGPVLPGSTEFARYESLEATFTGSYMTSHELSHGKDEQPTEVNLYRAAFDAKGGGTFGYLIQVFPSNPNLAKEFEMGLRIHS